MAFAQLAEARDPECGRDAGDSDQERSPKVTVDRALLDPWGSLANWRSVPVAGRA